MGELILVKGNVLNGTIETSVAQSGQYDFLSAGHTLAEGWLHQDFGAFDDAPKAGGFDWGGLFCNILAGLAVVAVVALACTGIGILAVGAGVMAASTASAMVTGAVIGGVVSVGACAIKDIQSGEVSSMSEYIFAAASGAITGAISSGVGASKFFQGLGKVIHSKKLLVLAKSGIMGFTGFATGFGTDVAHQICQGVSWSDIDWAQSLGLGVTSGISAGVFYWGSSKLMQLKPVQQLANKINQLPIVQKLTQAQTSLTNFIQNNAAKLNAFFNGGVSTIPTVNQLQASALQWWDDYKQQLSNRQMGKINKVCVAYDPTTGSYFFGVNKEYLGMGVDDPLISSLWPKESLNYYPIGNCAENAAIYKAILAQAQLDNLYLCTIDLKASNFGEIVNACANCTHALHGVVADNLSGWVINWKSNVLTALLSSLESRSIQGGEAADVQETEK